MSNYYNEKNVDTENQYLKKCKIITEYLFKKHAGTNSAQSLISDIFFVYEKD